MLKVGQKNYNEIDNNINSVNPLYLMINEMIGHFEEKTENKYLVLHDVDENKEVWKKNEEVWEGVKKEIEMINGGKKVEYGKDLKKIRFESNDDLAMNKPVKLHLLTIIIRSVFSEDGFFIHNFF